MEGGNKTGRGAVVGSVVRAGGEEGPNCRGTVLWWARGWSASDRMLNCQFCSRAAWLAGRRRDSVREEGRRHRTYVRVCV